MNLIKSLSFHLFMLVIASGLALRVWTRGEQTLPETSSKQAEIWGGSPEQVERVFYKDNDRKVTLLGKHDDQGQWFVGKLEKLVKTKKNPHDPKKKGKDGKPVRPTVQTRVDTVRFIAANTGKKLAERLAPMRAYRVGKLDKSRYKEFGFDKARIQGALEVTVAGQKHELMIGATTPGGIDRYAKTADGEVFVLGDKVVQDLMYSESRILDRDLHDFQMDEIDRVRVTRAKQSRELLRVEGKKDGWADVSTPTKLDETAGNWMAKVARIRVIKFIEKPKPPVSENDLLVRLEYFKKSQKLGFLDLYKTKSEKGDDEYLAKTEYTRWYIDVLKNTSEQIITDLDAVVK